MGTRRERIEVDIDADSKGVDAAANDLERLANSAEHADKSIHKTGQTSSRVDGEIGRLKQVVRDLGDEFERTGEKDLFKSLRKARSELGNLEKIKLDAKKLLPDFDGDSGRGLFGNIVAAFRGNGAQGGQAFGEAFMSVLKPLAVPAAIAFGVPLVATLVATISSAVLGATGLGGIALALAAQFHNPDVHKSITDLANSVHDQLKHATRNIIDPDAFRAFNREMAPVFDNLRAGLVRLSPYITMFAVKLGEAVAKLGPGLEKALAAAGPIIGALANQLPTLFNGLSDFFTRISANSKGAAEAITLIVKALSLTFTVAGMVVSSITQFFDVLLQGSDKVWSILAKINPLFKPIADYVHDVATSATEATLSTDMFAGSINTVGQGADFAASELAKAKQAADDWFGVTMSAAQADLGLATATANLTESIKQNGRNWDINTESGRANTQSLYAGIDAAKRSYDANRAAGMGAEQAGAQFRTAADKLLDQARAAGASDSEIQALKNSIYGLIDAESGIDRDITIRTHFLTEGTPPSEFYHGMSQGGIVAYAHGGITRAAAGVLPASSPGTILAAEPQTGGEALIPMRGISRDRAMSLAGAVGSRYGFNVVPDGGGYASPAPVGRYQSPSGGARPFELVVRSGGGRFDDLLVEILRDAIQARGGTVQTVLGQN